MARIEQPPPGRLICSIAYSHIDALADSLTRLEHQFGPVQFETVDIPYSGEARHIEEMGDNLYRRFFSFEKKVGRDKLADMKLLCRKSWSKSFIFASAKLYDPVSYIYGQSPA